VLGGFICACSVESCPLFNHVDHFSPTVCNSFALIATTYMPPHGDGDAGMAMSSTTPNLYQIHHLTTAEDDQSDNQTRNNELRCVYVRPYQQTRVAGQQSKQKCHGMVWRI
jgi:hypothetical protein